MPHPRSAAAAAPAEESRDPHRLVLITALATTAGVLGTTELPCPCEEPVQADSKPTIAIEIPEVDCARSAKP
jgi:hypothetical protein